MKKNTIIISTLALVLLLGSPQVFAEGIRGSTDDVTISSSHNEDEREKEDRSEDMEDRIKARGSAEIDRRILGLNKLGDRIEGMKRVSDDTELKLTTTIQAQIDALTALKAKIQSENNTDLKADKESITKSYRIFALVIPQGAILAAADRITTTADVMSAFGTKIQTRITEKKATGTDTTEAQKLLDTYTASIADAKVQAKAAIDLTATLTPDNGNQTVFEANKKALLDARAKLNVAREDLRKARTSVQEILKALGITKKME